MKKLLGIIILGLLLNGCSSTPVEIKNYKTECVQGDCINGQGTYTWKNGDKYVGDWINGERTGEGIYFASSGLIYVGEFKNGNLHGKGISKLNGSSCNGEFRNNEMYGQMFCINPDGRLVIGTITNGKWSSFKEITNSEYYGYTTSYQDPKPRLYYDPLTGGMKECAYDQGMTGICSSFKPFNSNSYDKDTLFYNPSTGAMQNCAGVVSVNGKCSAYGIFNHSKATADKGQLYYDPKNKKMTTCLFVDLNGVCKHYELVPNSWANNYGGFRMTDPNNPYLKRIPQTSQDFLDLGMRMLSGGCTLGLDC